MFLGLRESASDCIWERMGEVLSVPPVEAARSTILEDIDLTYERDVGSIGSKITMVEHISTPYAHSFIFSFTPCIVTHIRMLNTHVIG